MVSRHDPPRRPSKRSRARPNVSRATVSRVVNGSPKVSPDVVDGGERGDREAQLRAEPRGPFAGQPHLGRDRADRPRGHGRVLRRPLLRGDRAGHHPSARRERLPAEPARRLDRSRSQDRAVPALRRGRRRPRHLAPRGRRPAARGRHAAPARLRRPSVAAGRPHLRRRRQRRRRRDRHPAPHRRRAAPHRHDRPDRSTCPRASTASRATVAPWARPTCPPTRSRPPTSRRPAPSPPPGGCSTACPTSTASSSRATSWPPACSPCCASAVDRCPATSPWSASTTVPPRPSSAIPLTTVHQPSEQMGFEMADLLLRHLAGDPDVPHRNIMPTHLVRRASA